MARKTHNHQLDLPPLELDCMKLLWSLGEGSIRDIRSNLMPQRSLAYTTVMTVMDRLARKGLVERDRRGRAHLYRPLVAENLVREHAIGRLAQSLFSGSRDQLRQYLANPGARASGLSDGTESTASAPPREKIDPALL